MLGRYAISGKLKDVEYVDLVVTEFKISNRTLAKNNLFDHLISTIVCKLWDVFSITQMSSKLETLFYERFCSNKLRHKLPQRTKFNAQR